ncbi:leucine-rich repeat domain-containing protein [Cytophaga hutchinsonii]|uniref:Uncharacterized protein n=1 Tax=Cytophaga hutchinsonii (strain ATCC 33406 / DSM 1761 / CIP 103989 / NBRC 15051 / NCIMB 9469 / D465) TaxID=269798 RepID=A0A6N4SQ75_CYTH3|nr:leucine-rich repeat domain-containing protein [Cytophaga hutchinsonii]ABG58433.1 conserved hypothetical protein; leucine-rich repeat (LRR) protein [Cytophaga hutchinsonii ATCC 33406]SFX74372.1 Leucine Rich repeats (2 copies) [Cytophaga hutchinsonii ATCC 33406]
MKKYLYISVIYFLFAGIYAANAQPYYTIPDINLRNVLIRDYPAYMNAEGQLNVAAAKMMSADLNLDNADIQNPDGIQFFEKTGILRLRNNRVTNVSQLSYMKNLRRIYVNGNQITSIPNLADLYQLIDLYVGNNKITSIASIANKTTLLYLNAAGNALTEIPDLSALVNLKTLALDFNSISVLPDLSMNSNLQQLSISNTNIHSIPSLPTLLNLEIFNCEKTNMTDLSGLHTNTKLIKLLAQNCRVSTLPNFANKPNLTTVNLSENYLTFEDLIPLASLPNFSVFTYAPQKNISIPAYVDIRERNMYTYQIPIDPALTTNTFTWYKNNTPLLTNATGNYSFAPAFMSDSGIYSAYITNAALPGLTLKTNTSKLTVRTCMDISKLNISVLSSDCREGSLIDIAGTTVDGAVAPVNYILQSTSPVKNMTGITATQFPNIIPGTYVLQATDSRNCTTYKTFLLDKGSDCESVFSPNGDGIMDNYFIPDIGTVRIYNTSKKLIKTLQVPGAWDGSTDAGGMADSGYYVIIINESGSIGVSLMR